MAGNNYIPVKRLQELDAYLHRCPWCGRPVMILKSEGGGDGGDCRVRSAKQNGFYVRCLNCCVSYGYSPRFGGEYSADNIQDLIRGWNARKMAYKNRSGEGSDTQSTKMGDPLPIEPPDNRD